MHIRWVHPGSSSTSLRLFAGFLAARTCKPFVWDSKPGVTSYILLYEPVLKRADKSFREDVWSAEDDKQHTVQSLWEPGPKRRHDSGLSIISFDPGRLGGSWQRVSSDSRGWKKVTIVHNAALKAIWAMLPQTMNLQWWLFFIFITNKYVSTERAQGCGGWSYQHGVFSVCKFSQRLWVFPVWGGLATCPRCVPGGCGSEQKINWKPDNSLSTEEDIAALIVDLLQNHFIPGMVAGKSTQKSRYCKWRGCGSGDIQATATLKAILTTSQPWQSTNTPAECQNLHSAKLILVLSTALNPTDKAS